MKKILILLAASFLVNYVMAEVINDFEQDSSNWKAGNSTAEVTSKRYKTGRKSLHWRWNSENAVLRGEFQEHTVANTMGFGFWLHNPRPVDERLYVTFFEGGKKVAEVWFNLNFQGWRPLGVNFNKIGIMNGTKINVVEFKAPTGVKQGELFLDSVHAFVNTAGLVPDYQQPWINNQFLLKQPCEKTIFSTHDISLNRPYLPPLIPEDKIPEQSKKEMEMALDICKKRLIYGSLGKYSNMENLQKEFDRLEIKENDGIITGVPLVYAHSHLFLKAENALEFGYFFPLMHTVEQAYTKETGKNKEIAEDMFVKMCRHLLDQGFQEGNGNLGWIGNGYGFRHYPACIVRMKEVLLKHNLLADMTKSVAWFCNGDRMMSEAPTVSCDDFHNYTSNLPILVLLTPDLAECYQRMKALKLFYDKVILNNSPFGNDGSVHHHGGHHLGYGGYAPCTLMYTQLLPLKDTEFRISPEALEKLRKYTRAISFQSTYGKIAPNVYMRAGTQINLSASGMSRLLADMETPFDPEMAGIFLFSENGKITPDAKKYLDAGVKPIRPSGHLTLNMGALGIHRRDDWQVAAAGHLRSFRTLEIYGWTESNNYGAFSRNGSVFVTNHDDCGYRFEGWNWNYWPGATTVTRSSADLYEGYTMRGNRIDFGGGVTLGDNGIFGMDFQGGNDVRFKKSVFFFDNRITVITTDVNKEPLKNQQLPPGETVTTLFQQGTSEEPKPLYVNGKEIGQFPYSGELDGKAPATMIDSLGNGYYIWPGSPVKFRRQSQEWTYMFKKYLKDANDNPCIDIRSKKFREKPLAANEKYYNPTTSNFNLAYFDMGDAPKNASCAYTLLPATNNEELQKFASEMKGSEAPVQILAMTSDIHAVYDPQTKTTGYVVFNHQKKFKDIGPLNSINSPAFIMIKDLGDRYEVSVAFSDPNGAENFLLRLHGVQKAVRLNSNYPNSAVTEVPKL